MRRPRRATRTMRPEYLRVFLSRRCCGRRFLWTWKVGASGQVYSRFMFIAVVFAASLGLQDAPVLGQVRTEEDNSSEQDTTTDPNANSGIIGNRAGVSIQAVDMLERLAATSAASGLDVLGKKSAIPNHGRRCWARKPAQRLRFVSLPRLEKMATRRVDAGEPLTSEMQCLAGLFRADFLFVYPETGDVVIAGPADKWRRDEKGPSAVGSGGAARPSARRFNCCPASVSLWRNGRQRNRLLD